MSGLFPILEDGAVPERFVAEPFDQEIDEDPHEELLELELF